MKRSGVLLERDRLSAQLSRELARSHRGSGALVLVEGEAGIGKTALVEAFCRDHVSAHELLWGRCTPVVPAPPYGPLVEMARSVGGHLGAALLGGGQQAVAAAFLDLLRVPSGSVRVVVIDDLHWADQATLELFASLGRLVGQLPGLVIATYRGEALDGAPALRSVLEALPAAVSRQLVVPPLSARAVATLAADTGHDPIELQRLTAGNPYFVTEVLANPGDAVPATVRQAVLDRVARSSPAAQRVVRAAAVLGARFERDLLEQVVPGANLGLVDAMHDRLLVAGDDFIEFRHELARQAVLGSLPERERRRLHRQALAALRATPAADLSRMAQHALAARDGAAVLELAVAAGDRAARLGAHRQAASHFAAALRYSRLLEPAVRASLLERHAHECQVTDSLADALASQRAALRAWQKVGDVKRVADCLRALSMMLWLDGDGRRAMRTVHRAVSLLESMPERTPELARAQASLAQRLVNSNSLGRGRAVAQAAVRLAEQLGDEPTAVHALTTAGVAQLYLGQREGRKTLEQVARRALRARLYDDASRALINIVQHARDARDYGTVERVGPRALAITAAHQLALYERVLRVDLAEVSVERGRWNDASAALAELLAESATAGLVRARASIVMARLRARGGAAGVWSLLDEASDLLAGNEEGSERLPLLLAARVEATFLETDTTRAAAEGRALLAGMASLTAEGFNQWELGEYWFWAWRVGALENLPQQSAPPYLLHAAGRHRAAARVWRRMGCPYQQALALADSSVAGDLREALGLFHRLGAVPMARRVAHRLKAMGATAIPRGPRPATRVDPVGLTARQRQVFALLAQGLGDREIAERLVLSRKTVGHHVSAILRKTGARNRRVAVQG